MSGEVLIPGAGANTWGIIAQPDFEVLLRGFGARPERSSLLNCSENTTFRIESVRFGAAILRLYRVGHRTYEQILSELAWMNALRQDAGISTPRLIANDLGASVISINTSLGPTFAVAFSQLPGREPPEEHLSPWFGQLGALCARLHVHSRSWRRPQLFSRPILTWASLIGPEPMWGPWSYAPGLDSEAVPILNQVAALLAQRLEAYGTSPDRYGLIHGDLRLQNLLVDGHDVHLIDFDDCGSCWFLYDLATALSLLEDRADAEELLDRWISGYDSVQPLRTEDRDIVPDLIMLRRMQVLGWFGSRRDTEVAHQYAPQYVPATVAAADGFLRGRKPFCCVN